MFIYSLENSLIRFLICVEYLGLKVCGCYQLIEYLGLSGSFSSPLTHCLCLISTFFWTQVGFPYN